MTKNNSTTIFIKMEIHYVNLLHRNDRKALMEKELNVIKNIPIHRFDAIQPSFHQLYELQEKEIISRDSYIKVLSENSSMITKGSIGCFLSHWELLKKCSQEQKIFILLEDDVTLHPEFESIVTKGLESIYYNFDRIYLGQPHPLWKNFVTDFNSYFWKLSGGYSGTFGYIIHPNHASFLLKQIKCITNHIDNTFLTLDSLVKETKILLFKTPLVNTEIHRNRDSNVLLPRLRFKKFSMIIPFTLCFYDCQTIEEWKQKNPNCATQIFDSQEKVFEFLKNHGGFFVGNCKRSWSIQPIFQHCDLVIVKDSKLFYGCIPETFEFLFINGHHDRKTTLVLPEWFLI